MAMDEPDYVTKFLQNFVLDNFLILQNLENGTENTKERLSTLFQ